MPTPDKSLKDKAIKIQNKDYVLVSDRVIFFNEEYPEGSITTELVSEADSDMVIVKATVRPDVGRQFTGYSQATWGDGFINKTAALENAETSAVGRALALMGIGVIDSIASVDEIKKAQTQAARPNRTEEKYRTAVAGLLVKTGKPADTYEGKKLVDMGEAELLKAGKALAAEVEEA
jgi:2,4-dienoyl-CoA reductase-like NADH-dependent reductase (Old Yellow Enzyme family)